MHLPLISGLWPSDRSRLWIRCGQPISRVSGCRKASQVLGGDRWGDFPGTCSAVSSPTALSRSFAWRLWEVAVSKGSSTQIKAASSPRPTSWPGCRLRRSRSAGLGGSAATTTSSQNDCGGQSSTRSFS